MGLNDEFLEEINIESENMEVSSITGNTKRGRKPTNKPKREKQLKVLLTQAEEDKLHKYCEQNDMEKSYLIQRYIRNLKC